MKDDPKRQALAAEKAMRTTLAALSTVWTQATAVKQNLDTSKECGWLKATEYYAPFANACQAIDTFKVEVPMINKMILNDNFGHLTLCLMSGQWMET